MLPRQSGGYAREIRSPDAGLSWAADNDLDDNDDPEPVDTAVLKSRAVHVRDILSTFSRNDFPAEHIKENIFGRIAYLEGPKAIEDCVEKEDLVSTIFLLAVNNLTQYKILRHILPEEMCAQYFQQKLQRRIKAQIDAFDVLDMAVRGANPPDQDQIHGQVGLIATELNHIVMIIKDDREHRQQSEAGTAIHLIHMMQAVCSRNYRPGYQSAGRHKLSGDRNSNLFQALFGNSASHESRFGLNALKVFSRAAIIEQYEGLNIVRRLLVENDASQDYIRQFDEITDISVE
jgi:hypothetical protein